MLKFDRIHKCKRCLKFVCLPCGDFKGLIIDEEGKQSRHRVCLNCKHDIQLINDTIAKVLISICSILCAGRGTVCWPGSGSPPCKSAYTQQGPYCQKLRIQPLSELLPQKRQQIQRLVRNHRKRRNPRRHRFQRFQLLHEIILLHDPKHIAAGDHPPEYRQRPLRSCRTL